MTVVCQECGQELPHEDTKHTFEDCMKHRTKLFVEGLSKARVTLFPKDKKAFINVPLDFPKCWVVIEARLERRLKEVSE